jgi:hypothetical protein
MKNIGLHVVPSVKGHIFNLTINLIYMSIFYVFLGALLSWSMWRVFPNFDENWEKQSNLYQLADVCAEVSLIIIVCFWVTYYVNSLIPVLPVTSPLEGYLESFGGQTMFIYAVFLFLGTLDDKLRHVFHDFFGTRPT